RFLASLEAFRDGRLSILDLSAAAGSVASTLDNSSAPLPALFEDADSQLELAHFTSDQADHANEAERIVAPLLAAIDAALGP
ncbi:MAG: hypothetical protein KF703_05535, partial [Actinobacteria bacterium]|nr:hypothetical protein [Actinomycetota bacterium]